ncbi:MAG: hypothetical protein ACI83B_003191, partial [Sediminicola sp.]
YFSNKNNNFLSTDDILATSNKMLINHYFVLVFSRITLYDIQILGCVCS